MHYLVYASPLGGWNFEVWDEDRLVDNGGGDSQYDTWRQAVVSWARAIREQA